jgi:hypothetical protein
MSPCRKASVAASAAIASTSAGDLRLVQKRLRRSRSSYEPGAVFMRIRCETRSG